MCSDQGHFWEVNCWNSKKGNFSFSTRFRVVVLTNNWPVGFGVGKMVVSFSVTGGTGDHMNWILWIGVQFIVHCTRVVEFVLINWLSSLWKLTSILKAFQPTIWMFMAWKANVNLISVENFLQPDWLSIHWTISMRCILRSFTLRPPVNIPQGDNHDLHSSSTLVCDPLWRSMVHFHGWPEPRPSPSLRKPADREVFAFPMICPRRSNRTLSSSPEHELAQCHSYRSEGCLLLRSICIWRMVKT